VQRVARLAVVGEPHRDLAGGALGIDLDERRVDVLREPPDRAAPVRVVADARHEPHPAAGHAEVPRHVRRRAAELVARREAVPQHLAPDDHGVARLGHGPGGLGRGRLDNTGLV
jgi:hypothetical protein